MYNFSSRSVVSISGLLTGVTLMHIFGENNLGIRDVGFGGVLWLDNDSISQVLVLITAEVWKTALESVKSLKQTQNKKQVQRIII